MSAQISTAWKQVVYGEIGERVRKARDASGLTLRDVAFKLGISYQSVLRVEEGAGAPVHFLVAFAQLVDVSIESLVPRTPATFAHKIEKTGEW